MPRSQRSPWTQKRAPTLSVTTRVMQLENYMIAWINQKSNDEYQQDIKQNNKMKWFHHFRVFVAYSTKLFLKNNQRHKRNEWWMKIRHHTRTMYLRTCTSLWYDGRWL
jgi:hypothetical protein